MWIPQGYEESYKEFQSALSRNGTSMGAWFLKSMMDYVKRYGVSEQTHLDGHLDNGDSVNVEIERDIKSYYLGRSKKGATVKYMDIMMDVRNRVSTVRMAIAITDRISDALKDEDVNIWR